MNILKKVKLTLEKTIRNNRNFAYYIFIGGIATVVDFLILFLATDYLGIHYFYSAAISYCFGMITNYTLNKKYNFKNKSEKIFSQFSLFVLVAMVGLVLNQIVIYFLVDFLGFYYLFAKVFSVLVVLLWSFYGHKNITFKYIK